MIDSLRQMALAEGIKPAERSVYKLHEAFLASIRRFGRLHELSMILEHKLTSRDLLSNLDMGIDMLLRGKIHPLPKRIKGMDEIRALFEGEEIKMGRRYAFYPGCTLHSTGVEFGVSTELVCKTLGIEMEEIEDWNCCGASSAHSLDDRLYLALPARNLAKAQKTGLEELAIPCAACYSRLAAADLKLREDEAFRADMERRAGVRVHGAGAGAEPAGHHGQRPERGRTERTGGQTASGTESGVLLWLPAGEAAGIYGQVG